MNNPPNPFITIIVPFLDFNRHAQECIEGILSLDYENFELILVPDKKTKLPEFRKTRVIAGGKNTISFKRNTAIRVSDEKTEYFAFIDSDAFPEKSWLKNALRVFDENPEISAVGGPNLLPADACWREECASNAMSSPLVSGLKSFQNKISESRFVNDLPTCNLIVKKKVLGKIGLFDEKMLTGEDLELCERIVRSSGRIFYSKDVIVFHHRRKIFLPFLKQRFIYGMSIFKILRYGFNTKKAYLLIPPLAVIFFFSLLALSIYLQEARPILYFFTFFLASLCIFEGIRNSRKISQAAAASAVIFIYIFTPGIGAFYGLIRELKFKGPYLPANKNKKALS